MKRQIKDFWTYDEVLGLFNYMSTDLTYAELKVLISLMNLRLLLKKKERTDTNVWYCYSIYGSNGWTYSLCIFYLYIIWFNGLFII